jgi:hypothetical protein
MIPHDYRKRASTLGLPYKPVQLRPPIGNTTSSGLDWPTDVPCANANSNIPQRSLSVLSEINKSRMILATVISEEGRLYSRCLPVSPAELLVEFGLILLALTKREA